jgi:FKBP-type peptidyl-prolyl cis-trans isomerase
LSLQVATDNDHSQSVTATMGFFGQVIESGEVLEVPIPEEYYLHVHQVCVAPEMLTSKKPLIGPILVFAKTANDDTEYVVAVLNPGQSQYSSSLKLEFGTEDSPVCLRASAGTLHVTGQWSWDEDDECCGEDEEDGDEFDACEYEQEQDEEDDEEESVNGADDEEDNDDTEANVPLLVEIADETVVEEPTKGKKKKPAEDESKPLKQDKTVEPLGKKARVEPSAVSSVTLKKWKVIPDCDEGVAVPEPKTIKKAGGLEITDHIIGKGDVPKGGAVVKITYEGMFPDGTVFDQKLKRKAPFTFRKGTGQVIVGMDKGIDGMRVGGAREILIPSHLG